MSLVVVETAAEQPITDEALQAADQQVLPCLEARNVVWRYSLLSVDRHRMICTFDAPDAESVRDSYRKAGLPSRSIWTGDLIQPEAAQRQRNLTYVMEGTYPPLSETDWSEISRKILDYCVKHDVQWLQSYLSLDRTKVICELNAPDPEPIQETQHKLSVPFNRVWLAEVLKP